jgi:methyl-accepting chemotaxis protein
MNLSSLSIKQKLILSVIAVLGLLVTLQTWLEWADSHERAEQDAASFSTHLSKIAAAQLGVWLDDKLAMIKAIKTPSNAPSFRQSLIQTQQGGSFDLVYLGKQDGQFIPDDASYKPAPGYDPRQRPWYQGAMQRSPYFSPPYVDSDTQELVMTIAVHSNEGVLGGDLMLKSVNQQVLSLATDSIDAFILDAQGKILVHPKTEYVLKPVTQWLPDLSAYQLRKLASNKAFIHLPQSAAFVSLTAIPGTDWYLGMSTQESTVFEQANAALIDSILFNLLLMLVICAVLFFLISKLLRPLKVLQLAIDELARGDGDLTHRIALDRHDEIGLLSVSVDNFVAKLHTLIGDIAAQTHHLSSSADHATNSASLAREELSRQQLEVTQVAAAVNELSATASEVASSAELTASAAMSSSVACEQGKKVIVRNQEQITSLAKQLETATHTVAQLEANTQEIHTILETISEIAEQTNLLALNAAIEAARAGEQGRGFAVVADEVRTLSQRTHNSTNEIRTMIERLQQNTGATVQTMNDSQHLAHQSVTEAQAATDALEQITESIVQISDMATHISSAAEEQRAVTEEVSRNTQGIQDVSNQLTDQAHVSAKEAETLRNIAQQLTNKIGMFTI